VLDVGQPLGTDQSEGWIRDDVWRRHSNGRRGGGRQRGRQASGRDRNGNGADGSN
jgi:hypothetical protein